MSSHDRCDEGAKAMRKYVGEGAWAVDVEEGSRHSPITVRDTRDDSVVGFIDNGSEDHPPWEDVALAIIEGRPEVVGPPDATRVQAICWRLGAEPLFHFSLHSKELFHSNLLAWFIDAYPAEARELFSQWVPERPGAAFTPTLREKNRLDLVIHLQDLAPCVIENKVLTTPDDEQLDGYAAKNIGGLEEPTLILLSLIAPGWGGESHRSPSGQEWTYLSYVELADGLEQVGKGLAKDDDPDRRFVGEVLTRYSGMVRNLHRLVRALDATRMDQQINLGDAIMRELHPIRMDAPVGKQRAGFAARCARAQSGDEICGRSVHYKSALTRGLALVEAFLLLPNGDEMGWQYQNGEWRLVIRTGPAYAGPSRREERHQYVEKNYADWFSFEKVTNVIGCEDPWISPTEKRGEYLGFDPDFVYRLRRVPELTFDGLVQLSDHYLTIAADWAVSPHSVM
jgi:hypothetical protein